MLSVIYYGLLGYKDHKPVFMYVGTNLIHPVDEEVDNCLSAIEVTKELMGCKEPLVIGKLGCKWAEIYDVYLKYDVCRQYLMLYLLITKKYGIEPRIVDEYELPLDSIILDSWDYTMEDTVKSLCREVESLG